MVAARTPRSQRRSGCRRRPCASGCNGCSTRASCRSSRSPTRCASACTARRWSASRSTATSASVAAKLARERRDRLRRHLLGHVRPARRADRARRRAPARSDQRADPFDPGHPLDRDLRVPPAREADLYLGNVMTTTSIRHTDAPPRNASLDALHARCPDDTRRPDHRARRRARGSTTTTASSYLDGLAGLFVSQVGHGRAELADAAAEQTRELAYFPVWSYAHPRRDRARRTPRRPRAGRPRPRVLHDRRQRSRRVGVEARAPVLPGDRPARIATR